MAAAVQTPTAAPAAPPHAPELVHFSSGGFKENRRVLKGAEAKPVFDRIPVVDFSALRSTDALARAQLVESVRKAASEVGFFYAANTPVPRELMDEAFKVIKTFFDQPFEDKMRIFHHSSPAAKGYLYAKREDGFVFRDSFTMGRDHYEPEQHHIAKALEGSRALNQWPDETLPEFRKVMYRYHNELHAFSLELLKVFSLALGMPENALDKFFKAPLTDITVQHYPAQDPVKPGVVLYPHADHSAFTILLQSIPYKVPSLQVLNPNSEWIPAPPIDYAFVINTGNYMENWSNGRFPSTVHRVYNEHGVERYSLPFFLSPDPDTVVEPLKECMRPGEEAMFDPWDIGKRHVKGLFGSKQDHPYVRKWRELGIDEATELRYSMLSKPQDAEWDVLNPNRTAK